MKGYILVPPEGEMCFRGVMQNLRNLICSSRTILWDWNGTLLDDISLAAELLNRTILRYGAPPITLERYREIYEHPLTLLYERCGVDLSLVSIEQLAREWHELYEVHAHEARLQSGALELLEFFRRRGTPQHILSALPKRLLDKALLEREVTEYFGIVSGLREGEGSTKFHSGRELMEALGVRGEDALLIGDTSHDAEVASSLGISCILIASGAESPHRLQTCGKPIVSTLLDLLQILDGSVG